jgi:hypothetical protein
MSPQQNQLHPLLASMPEVLLATGLLSAVVVLAFVGMWSGWRRRGRKHELPELVAAPPVADLPPAKLQAGARYFGTTVAGDWLDRVVARGLGSRSSCRLSLSDQGLDVIRLAGSFRIPARALRGARHDMGIAGKVVPPHGLLVVTWEHGDYVLDTGFRLSELSGPQPALTGQAPDKSVTDAHNLWIRSIGKIAKEHTA